MGNPSFSRDAAIARIAAEQYGLITLGQAMAVGIAPDALRRRVKAGVLVRACPNVFRLAAVPRSWKQRAMAASLWVGPNGAVGGRCAAALHRLDGFGPPTKIEVVTPRRLNSPTTLLGVHRTPFWCDQDRVVVGGIGVTSVERTLASVAGWAHEELLEVALEDGLRRGLTDCPRVRDCLQRLPPNQPGRRKLEQLLEARGSSRPAESALEVKVIRLFRAHGYPRPLRQKVLDDNGRFVGRVDLAFPERRLIIEVDGFRFHTGRAAWDRDRERRNALTALGWVVLHATSALIHDQQAAFLRDVARAYSRPL